MNTIPFTAGLRVRPNAIRLGSPDAEVMSIRVQVPETWDAVRIDVPSTEPVLSVKTHALEELYPGTHFHDDFVLKFRGWEVLDENATLADIGAQNGSIFLLTHRRRRPVR